MGGSNSKEKPEAMMLALRTSVSGQAVVEEVPIPEPGQNEALIKVLRAGICSTDLQILKGYFAFSGTLGHEFVGEVVRFGSNTDECPIKVGDRVVGEINAVCSKCAECQLGGVMKRNHCSGRTVMGILKQDGCFSEYIVMPVDNLSTVPDSVSTTSATFVELLAAAFRIVEQDLIKPTDKVAVIGDGKLGLLITQVVHTQPHAELTLLGHHEEKMDLLPDGGIKKVLSNQPSVMAGYEDYFDVVIEASGSPSGVMMAVSITRPLGTVVLKTTCAADSNGFDTAPFVVKELHVVGSRCGNFQMALDCLASGTIDVCRLLAQEYPLAEGVKAISHASRPGTLQIHLVMQDNN